MPGTHQKDPPPVGSGSASSTIYSHHLLFQVAPRPGMFPASPGQLSAPHHTAIGGASSKDNGCGLSLLVSLAFNYEAGESEFTRVFPSVAEPSAPTPTDAKPVFRFVGLSERRLVSRMEESTWG